jgi:hypothetical protein
VYVRFEIVAFGGDGGKDGGAGVGVGVGEGVGATGINEVVAAELSES